jgi:hypothetical protein
MFFMKTKKNKSKTDSEIRKMAKNRKLKSRGEAIDPDVLFLKQNMMIPTLDIKSVYLRKKEEAKNSKGKIPKLTWAVLAKRVGMKNKSNIHKWMDHKNHPNLTFRTLKLISIALREPLRELISETEKIGEKEKMFGKSKK